MSQKQFDVRFGSVSIQAEKCSIGCKVKRKDLPITTADKLLTNAQLSATLKCDPAAAHDEDKDQQKLVETSLEMDVVMDCKGFSVRKSELSFTLAAAVDDVNTAKLGAYASQNGSLAIERTGDKQPKPKKGEHATPEEALA